MFRRWEVQPGMGEAILAGIGNDIRSRNEIGPSIPMMELAAQFHEQTADVLLAEQDQKAGAPYDLDFMSRTEVSVATTERQLRAALEVRKLIEQARELEAKTYLDKNNPDFRVRIEALESGVVGWRESGGAGGSETEGETELLEAGEVREGRGGMVRSIATAPHLGGKLVMDFPGEARLLPVRRGVHVTGLVSPETYEPQVDLQILTKNG